MDYYSTELTQHAEVFSKIREEIYESFANLIDDCVKAIQGGNK